MLWREKAINTKLGCSQGNEGVNLPFRGEKKSCAELRRFLLSFAVEFCLTIVKRCGREVHAVVWTQRRWSQQANLATLNSRMCSCPLSRNNIHLVNPFKLLAEYVTTTQKRTNSYRLFTQPHAFTHKLNKPEYHCYCRNQNGTQTTCSAGDCRSCGVVMVTNPGWRAVVRLLHTHTHGHLHYQQFV